MEIEPNADCREVVESSGRVASVLEANGGKLPKVNWCGGVEKDWSRGRDLNPRPADYTQRLSTVETLVFLWRRAVSEKRKLRLDKGSQRELNSAWSDKWAIGPSIWHISYAYRQDRR
jgi:hypothetical protein